MTSPPVTSPAVTSPLATPKPDAVDAVVVGSGHNALVAACYLARAGWSVEVLERDDVLGGAVSTVERFPGYRVDRGSSAHIMIRHTGIVEDLALADVGLRYLDCDPWAFAPAVGERAPLVFHRCVDATCLSIENACGSRDADAYRRFVDVWTPRSKAVLRAFGAAPTAAHLGRAFWGLDAPGGGAALSREFLQSGDALLDGWFDDERLKAALAWFGAQSGPPMSEPGTAPMVGFAALMHTLPPGRAIGGSGALADALVARLHSLGGTVTAADAVTSLRRDGDRWLHPDDVGTGTDGADGGRGLSRRDHARPARSRRIRPRGAGWLAAADPDRAWHRDGRTAGHLGAAAVSGRHRVGVVDGPATAGGRPCGAAHGARRGAGGRVAAGACGARDELQRARPVDRTARRTPAHAVVAVAPVRSGARALARRRRTGGGPDRGRGGATRPRVRRNRPAPARAESRSTSRPRWACVVATSCTWRCRWIR